MAPGPTTLVGLGLDLIELERFRQLYGADDVELLRRCFSDDELTSVGTGVDRLARLAARFAAKEATYKALGGPKGVAHTDIVVSSEPSGKPILMLHGAAKIAAAEAGISSLLCSFSHSDTSVAAVVVALGAIPR
ncbi:MAG: 4'-phosphopantetheinyl transferase superfamily protein [Rhodospirillaceae bacterium]|nr:4'-phosphopantetheinyl transferase superfamily protein [Rhodospirillaceae bacterium]